MTRAPRPTDLAAGLALVVLGALLVLDAGGTIPLRFAYIAPAVVAALGIVLLASGIEARTRGNGRGATALSPDEPPGANAGEPPASS